MESLADQEAGMKRNFGLPEAFFLPDSNTDSRSGNVGKCCYDVFMGRICYALYP